MRLKGVKKTRNSKGTYSISPIYWGKRGGDVTLSSKTRHGMDLQQLLGELLLEVRPPKVL